MIGRFMGSRDTIFSSQMGHPLESQVHVKIGHIETSLKRKNLTRQLFFLNYAML
jgi:hypothetical protein